MLKKIKGLFSRVARAIGSLPGKIFRRLNSLRNPNGETNFWRSYYTNMETVHAGRDSSASKPHFHVANFFDVLASMVFFAALIIALKPELLLDFAIVSIFGANEIQTWHEFIDCFGSNIFSFVETVSDVAKNIRNFIVFFGIVFFIIMKLIVIFSAFPQRKIVPILVFALSIVTCVLVKEKFLLFLIYIVVLYLTFEFSCGFKKSEIVSKIFSLAILFFLEYVALHIFMIKEVAAQLALPSGIRLW